MDVVLDFLARLTPLTVLLGAVAMAGVFMTFLGLTSTSPLDLQISASRAMGVQERGQLERWQRQLHMSGIYVSVYEVLLIGGLLGLSLCAALLALNLLALGVAALGVGPLLYVAFLSWSRDRAISRFRDGLPDAIDDVADLIKARGGSLHDVVARMATRGPKAVRAMFAEINLLVSTGERIEHAVQQAARLRNDPFLTHFCQVLVDHYTKSNPHIHEVLSRIARALRDQTSQKRNIHAAQAGSRLVSIIYGLAPTIFLLIFRSLSGDYSTFYSTPTGQVVQVCVVLTGVASFWFARKIGGRGLETGHLGNVRAKGTFRPAASTVRKTAPPTPGQIAPGAPLEPDALDPQLISGPGPVFAHQAAAAAGAVGPAVSAGKAQVIADAQRDLEFARAQTAQRYAEHPVLGQAVRSVQQMVNTVVNGHREQYGSSPLQLRGRRKPSAFGKGGK